MSVGGMDARYMGGVRRRRLRCRLFGCRYLCPDDAYATVFGSFCRRCGRKW